LTDPLSTDLLAMTSDVVCAFLSRNNMPAKDLAPLIRTTFESLAKLGSEPKAALPPEPVIGAVTLRKSLASPEHIISMIDGKPYRTLKRHLGTHGLTPDEYRSLYKLPGDYPMVAPAYAAVRSEMAKRIGLGRKASKVVAPPVRRRTLKIAGPKTR
jgi:predicted transcriptional regulator